MNRILKFLILFILRLWETCKKNSLSLSLSDQNNLISNPIKQTWPVTLKGRNKMKLVQTNSTLWRSKRKKKKKRTEGKETIAARINRDPWILHASATFQSLGDASCYYVGGGTATPVSPLGFSALQNDLRELPTPVHDGRAEGDVQSLSTVGSYGLLRAARQNTEPPVE